MREIWCTQAWKRFRFAPSSLVRTASVRMNLARFLLLESKMNGVVMAMFESDFEWVEKKQCVVVIRIRFEVVVSVEFELFVMLLLLEESFEDDDCDELEMIIAGKCS
jgi:hypothetical protein